MSLQSQVQEERFGLRLQEFSESLAATTSAQRLIAPDGDRVSLTLINESTVAVWVRIGKPGSAGVGLRLAGSGGGVIFTLEDDPNIIGQAMYLITASGTATVEAFGSRGIGPVSRGA